MVNALLLVGAVPLGLLDAPKLDPDLGLPGATYTSLDMNWRALLERLGTPQLPDIILSSAQHRPIHDKHKPDILIADPPSVAASETNTPSEVKVAVSSPSPSSSSQNQEAVTTSSSESRLPLAHWLREALSVLQHKQDEEEAERDAAVGREEWKEAGALLRKIGDLLDGCTWNGKERTTSTAFRLPSLRPLACCCCCLAASVVGLLTCRFLLWCR